MAELGPNRWGKSQVRVSKIHRGAVADDISDVTVSVLCQGDVEAAHTQGDNSAVLPTDTMKNTVYALAQDYLTRDLETFALRLADHFLDHDSIHQVSVALIERVWQRETATGFLGGSSARRVARISRGQEERSSSGVEDLVVLKTRGSAFTGFPRDDFTTLAETDDRLLATSITAEWVYERTPEDTAATWGLVCRTMIDSFFAERSDSVQHQGFMMGEAVLAALPEVSEIRLSLPNQHHLPFDLTSFGISDHGTVFQPVSEPYGDIALTVRR